MGFEAEGTKVGWNKVFRPIHESKHRYIVMKGSAGSGKSVDTAQFYIVRLMADVGRNLLVVRKTENANKDSTFAELCGAINRMGLWNYWKATSNPLRLKCVNGNEILFRGVYDRNQQQKVKSITLETGYLTDIWVEEATELTPEDFEILDDRLRGKLPEPLFYQIKLTFNPVAATHWIKGQFFDKEDSNVLTHHSTYLDNRFIDQAYYYRMQRRKELDPDGYQIYGLGEWGETGGLIFTNFVIKPSPYKREDFDDFCMGQDFGFNHANCVLQVGYKDGDLYICRELYTHQKDQTEIIELLNQQRFPQRVRMYCDSAEPDRIKQMRDAGYSAIKVRKPPGSVKAQIDWIKGRMIYIDPSCVNTIKEIQAWKWKKDGNGNYLDDPVPVFDDAMAALRYSVEAWRRGSVGKAEAFIPEYEVFNETIGW